MAKQIHLSNSDKTTTVDDENYEFLNQWLWQASTNGYVVRRVTAEESPDQKSGWMYMHELVAFLAGMIPSVPVYDDIKNTPYETHSA